MARGIGGYGRYEDDLAHVGCPWSRSSETPCAARDGRLAISRSPRAVCAGCNNYVLYLIADLADDYPPAGATRPDDEAQAADWFRDLVLQATAPLAEGKGSDRPGPPPG